MSTLRLLNELVEYSLSSFLWIVQQFLIGKKKNIPLLPVFSRLVLTIEKKHNKM